MQIAIVGAGGVGGFIGALLTEAGHDITFIARGNTAAVLRNRGLRFTDDRGTRIIPVKVIEGEYDADITILATKVTDSLLPPLPKTGLVLTTQNAVEFPDKIAEQIGAARTWPGVIRGYFHREGAADISFRGGPKTLGYGTFDGSDHPLLEQLTQVLESSGINPRPMKDIWVDLWLKAMFIGPSGGLGALVQQPMGVLRTQTRGTLEGLATEVATVGRANGIDLPDGAVGKVMEFFDLAMPEATSSMHRDLSDGAPDELDAQIGAIVRAGAKTGVATPLHKMLLEVLRAKIN
ncbi:MAG: 2-dehydropantoate 2-reductase [Propionibacteriaceae bacterium]